MRDEELRGYRHCGMLAQCRWRLSRRLQSSRRPGGEDLGNSCRRHTRLPRLWTDQYYMIRVANTAKPRCGAVRSVSTIQNDEAPSRGAPFQVESRLDFQHPIGWIYESRPGSAQEETERLRLMSDHDRDSRSVTPLVQSGVPDNEI